MDRIEDMTGPTPELARLVKAGMIQARATVYVNAPGGLGAFVEDLRSAGFGGTVVEGSHYVVNGARTDALRPYTGEVWLNGWTKEALREAAPMLIERDSHPRMFGTAIHCYNNPLYRLVVRLGALGADEEGFASRPSAVAAVPSPELAEALAKARLDRLDANAKECRERLSHEEFVADGLRKGGFLVSASERAAKASRLRRKLHAIETELARASAPVPLAG